jgi:hypothetical protein
MIGLMSNAWLGAEYSLGMIEELGPEHRAAKSQGGHKVRTLRLQGGKTTDLGEYAVEQLLTRPVQLIPAEPGIGFCYWDLDEAEPRITTVPLIAWALCFDGEIRAVTPNGVNGHNDGEDNFVRLPDGRFRAVGQFTEPPGFQDEAALLSHLLDEKMVRDEHNRAAACHAQRQAEQGA